MSDSGGVEGGGLTEQMRVRKPVADDTSRVSTTNTPESSAEALGGINQLETSRGFSKGAACRVISALSLVSRSISARGTHDRGIEEESYRHIQVKTAYLLFSALLFRFEVGNDAPTHPVWCTAMIRSVMELLSQSRSPKMRMKMIQKMMLRSPSA